MQCIIMENTLIKLTHQTRFTHSKDVYFAITKRFSIVQLCAVHKSNCHHSPAVQLKQLNAHAHLVAAIRAVCRRARDIQTSGSHGSSVHV